MIHKNCSWCDSEFVTTQSNQIYCSVECRDRASREKIIARYVMIKRKKRLTKDRKCAGGCGTSLSIYNDSKLCTNCLINQRKYGSFLKELKGMLNEAD